MPISVKEYPLWWEASPELLGDSRSDPHRNEAALLPRADVVVIGAGYTGLSAARQLAKAGASVLVVEAARAGWGASSRNAGQVLTGLSVEPAALVTGFGEARAAALFESGLEAIAALEELTVRESIACDLDACGHLQAAWKAAHFDALREEQALLARVFHHRVELVSKADQRSEIGTDRYHGLLVDERSRSVDPARFATGLAAAARRAGASIAEHTPVTHVTKKGNGWAVETSRGTVDARDLIVATNGYSGTGLPVLSSRLIPVGSYIVATVPLDSSLADRLLPKRRMAFDSKHFLYYFRLTPDRRLLFGGRAEFSRPTAASTRRAAAILRDGMTTIFPELATVEIEFGWGGNVAFTRDRLPHGGRMDGIYYAGGYCGHGIAMATHLGELVARLLSGETVRHPLFDGPDRSFPAIPFYNGRPWFLPAAGLYYRLLDAIS